MHHGIKGQKWGVRRFENEDGTLTPEGKKRYYQDENGEYKRKTHKMKLVDKYTEDGLSSEAAEKKANDVLKAERTVAIGAGLVAAAATAVVVYKYRKDHKDDVVKTGTHIQRIDMDSGDTVRNEFFGAHTKSDKVLYDGKLTRFRQMQGINTTWKKDLEVQSDIKVASKANAEKAFKQLLKEDSDFARSVPTKNYEQFNRQLVGQNHGSSWAQKYYKKLQTSGYGAITDLNDKKYSGFQAKNPLIYFGDSAGKIKVTSSESVNASVKKDIKALGAQYLNIPVNYVENYGYRVAAVGAGGASAIGGAYVAKTKNNQH